jgi:hypothetical protein
VRSRKGGRTEQTAAEARAFFVGPVDQADGYGRPAVKLGGEAAKNFEAGEEIEAAVEPTAVGDGIEVASDQQGFLRFAG